MNNQTHSIRLTAAFLLYLILSITGCGKAAAQQFRVSKFTTLTYDINAFINPVYDLNDEACAVIKIVAPEEFAFSSPLGIVKRRDEVGEILLYLPRGSKKLTIKHPQWGVLRDYTFPKPLESRLAYELTLEIPHTDQVVRYDTVVLTKTITDTITVGKPHRSKQPWAAFGLITVSVHEHGPSFGVMLALRRRHGFYIHGQTDLRRIGSTVATSDKEGYLDGSPTMPYYTDEVRHANYTVTGGLVHRLFSKLNIFYGGGYGRTATIWRLAESEGGGYVLNDGLTHRGVAGELGVLGSFGRFSVSASMLTVAGKQWQGTIGFGIKIGEL